jgi:hypothetical protein
MNQKMIGTSEIMMLAIRHSVKINRVQGTTFKYKTPGKLS